MKSILYSVCSGSLALALATVGAQAATDKNKRQESVKPQQRTAKVQSARPAKAARPASAMPVTAKRPTSAMPATARADRKISAAQNRQQRSYANVKPRTGSAVNRAPRQTSATRAKAARPAVNPAAAGPATIQERNLANNERMRERQLVPNGAIPFRTTMDRRAYDAAKNRANRNRNADVNRFRNTNEFRNRNNVAINRNRNFNRTQNTAFYRGRNVRVTNNWRGDAFRGQRYWAFRNYNRQWHNRSWWRSNYTRIVFVNSGWWYWNAGYWFPAWGYAPSVSYVYDGPIYGYNGLSPDQVTVNVQQQLAAAGYYDGPIDGQLGPMTREAIAAYQADNGLAVTSAIDEPTLATMGLV